MITIGNIPRKTKAFFNTVKSEFGTPAFSHFCGLVMAITIGHCSTIKRLARLLRNSTHRTNHGEFLWRSNWNELSAIQQIALDMLRSLFTKKTAICFSLSMTPKHSSEPKNGCG